MPGPCVREWEGIGVYRGEFVEAEGQKVAQGAGRFEYANGDHYDGEWHAGCKQGAGVHLYCDGVFAARVSLRT